MQPYNKAVMTDKGIELLNKAQAGLCQIEITRMAIGDGDYLAAEKKEEHLKEQLSLKNEKNRYPISSKGVASDNSIIITSIFSNQDPITYEVLVEEGYCISEIGVFAKESRATEEILYSIAVAEETGDYMPAFEGSNPAQIIQSYQIAVNNMETAEVVINYAGAAMLASEGQAHVADQERHITAEERECWNNKLDTNSNISKRQVGLENVDNTSDAEKPISAAQQAAITEAKTAASQAATAAATAQSTANAAQTAATNAATAAANAASKSIYGDTAISLGRLSGSTTGENSYAVGDKVTASGSYSHAEGLRATASGHRAHAKGYSTTASGNNAYAEGESTTASGVDSHAEGYMTTALDYQHAQGHYNDTSLATAYNSGGTSTGTAFVIGNGTSSAKSNALRVTGEGKVFAKAAYNSTGADYAEFAEWADGNLDNEDRRGYFVTFDETKPNMIRKANEGEYILGIVSGNPCVIGNADEGWLGKYEFDEFGAIVYEDIEEEVEYIDEENGEIKTKLETITTYKLNPEYDPERKYIHRSERPEWDYIGWIGVLSVRDDGTCIPGGYCKVADGGIATAAERCPETYRVLERVNGNIVKVALK